MFEKDNNHLLTLKQKRPKLVQCLILLDYKMSVYSLSGL